MRVVFGCLTAASLLSVGCPASTACLPGDDPQITLGQGVAEAFEPYTDGQTVTIEPASQGGFGVPILIRSVGLAAGDDQDARVIMETVVDGEITGTWTQNTQLTCPDDQGGRTPSTLHVGFDPAVYSSPDDFIDLEGESIDLDVRMEDADGNSARIVQTVTLTLGG